MEGSKHVMGHLTVSGVGLLTDHLGCDFSEAEEELLVECSWEEDILDVGGNDRVSTLDLGPVRQDTMSIPEVELNLSVHTSLDEVDSDTHELLPILD